MMGVVRCVGDKQADLLGRQRAYSEVDRFSALRDESFTDGTSVNRKDFHGVIELASWNLEFESSVVIR